MTAIPIFPPGPAPGPAPEPGDWHGLWTGVHNALHRIAGALPDPRTRRREAAQNVWSVDIDPTPMVPQQVAGVWYLDIPQLFSASLGEHWDVHVITATGYTAGSVSAWINVPVIAANGAVTAGALRGSFPSAGLNNYGKGQCHLRANDRLVFIGTGIVVPAGGQVLISLSATRVADEYWGEYLL